MVLLWMEVRAKTGGGDAVPELDKKGITLQTFKSQSKRGNKGQNEKLIRAAKMAGYTFDELKAVRGSKMPDTAAKKIKRIFDKVKV